MRKYKNFDGFKEDREDYKKLIMQRMILSILAIAMAVALISVS